APRGRAGFTLIEVLVALVLTVLLGGVIFQVVQGESRFATVQSAREEVQQNSRGALEVLGSELRSVQRAGLVSATSTSITFLLPRVWGVSCGVNGGVLAALFPAAGGVSFDINSASGVLGDMGGGAWGPSPNPVVADRATVTALAAINPALGTAASPCNGIRATADPNGYLVGRTITGTNIPAVPAGNTLYLYQYVTYDVAQPGGSSGTEWWIRRNLGTGSTTQQPLAGPLNGANGLTFTYWDASGNAIAAPITAAATLQTVARIGITVTAASRAKGRASLTNTQSTSVVLRNQ
ncbi:MAG: prepilin-type N-terminal cleavage/methylation domain-containing protein, partial [Longimicrobiaceae bacterium]